MSTQMYNATVEVDRRGDVVLPVDVDALMTGLAEYSPAPGTSARGWLEVRISLPASSLAQATTTALAVVTDAVRRFAVSSDAIACTVMTEEEFNAREDFVDVPQVLGTNEVAERLGVSPQRVRQLVVAGKLQTVPGAGSRSALMFPADAVEAFARRERPTGRPGRARQSRIPTRNA